MKNSTNKTFEKWKIDELHQTFKLKKHYDNFPLLQEWLNVDVSILNTEDRKTLEKLRSELAKNAAFWNEDELKFFFIGQLISVIDYTSEHFKVFTQRPLSAEVNGTLMKGVVDFVIATGIGEPQNPFFFIHEYKQERKGANDPLAQVLSEMLVAQQLNNDNFPLYSCYVLGRFWFFIVLDHENYAVSNAYNASDEDIIKIAAILRKSKENIEKHLNR